MFTQSRYLKVNEFRDTAPLGLFLNSAQASLQDIISFDLCPH